LRCSLRSIASPRHRRRKGASQGHGLCRPPSSGPPECSGPFPCWPSSFFFCLRKTDFDPRETALRLATGVGRVFFFFCFGFEYWLARPKWRRPRWCLRNTLVPPAVQADLCCRGEALWLPTKVSPSWHSSVSSVSRPDAPSLALVTLDDGATQRGRPTLTKLHRPVSVRALRHRDSRPATFAIAVQSSRSNAGQRFRFLGPGVCSPRTCGGAAYGGRGVSFQGYRSSSAAAMARRGYFSWSGHSSADADRV